MGELTSLRNIGKEMERKLKSIEISSEEELKRMGSKETWQRELKEFIDQWKENL